MAFAGDVDQDGFGDVLVGAPGVATGAGYDVGSAVLFSGFDGSVIYQWFGQAQVDGFGSAVASAGDINGDGHPDLIVGAPRADPGGLVDAGTVYIYSGSNGLPMHIWNGLAAGDRFGNSVAAAGDLNGDGWNDVIVGAYYADDLLGNAFGGAAYVKSGLTSAVLLEWHGGAGQALLGQSVAGAGDVDGDGTPDLVVGAPYMDNGGFIFAGSAFVYSGANGAVLHQWQALENAQLGHSVAGVGDVNGDGHADLLVGAPFASPLGVLDAGSVLVYSGLDGTVLREHAGGAASAQLGSAVAGIGDLDSDGIGDYAATKLGTGGGYMYAYSGANGGYLEVLTGVGDATAAGGDTNGDGLSELIGGDSGYDHAGHLNVGRAFVHGFNTYLNASTNEASLATGAVVDFYVNFQSWVSASSYMILISASGTGPTPVGNLQVPLTVDAMLVDSFFGKYPVPIHSNMHGLLGGGMDAHASLTAPAGLPPSLVGATVYFAAIGLASNGVIVESSVAQPLVLTP